MMIRGGRRRRGDVLLALNPTRIGMLSGALVSIVVLTFALGYYLGRASNGIPVGAERASAMIEPSTAVTSVNSSSPKPAPVSISPPVAAARPDTVRATPQRTESVRPAVAPPAAAPAPASTSTSGYRYAIVAGSVPIGDDLEAAKADADRRVSELRAKGFREARADRVEIAGKGSYFRVVAREAIYPSASVAKRDIESMKRRGEIASGFPVKLGDAK